MAYLGVPQPITLALSWLHPLLKSAPASLVPDPGPRTKACYRQVRPAQIPKSQAAGQCPLLAVAGNLRTLVHNCPTLWPGKGTFQPGQAVESPGSILQLGKPRCHVTGFPTPACLHLCFGPVPLLNPFMPWFPHIILESCHLSPLTQRKQRSINVTPPRERHCLLPLRPQPRSQNCRFCHFPLSLSWNPPNLSPFLPPPPSSSPLCLL